MFLYWLVSQLVIDINGENVVTIYAWPSHDSTWEVKVSQGTSASSFADDTRVLRGTKTTSDCNDL